MTLTPTQRVIAVAALLALAWVSAGRGCRVPLPVAQNPDAATFVYEKDEHQVPSPVLVALDKLNRQGVLATTHEVDTTDGAGEIPEQYKVPVEAAKQAGLPALVVTAKGKVVCVVKSPKTEQEVLEAAK